MYFGTGCVAAREPQNLKTFAPRTMKAASPKSLQTIQPEGRILIIMLPAIMPSGGGSRMKQYIPNLLSLSRLLATVLIAILVLINQPWAFLVATLLFFLASVSDFFDGYLARRFHVASNLGVFLD